MSRSYEQDYQTLKSNASTNIGLTGANRDMQSVMNAVDLAFESVTYIDEFETRVAAVETYISTHDDEYYRVGFSGATWDGIKTFNSGVAFLGGDKFDYYDSGTWTPSIKDDYNHELVDTIYVALYTRIGNLVFFTASIKCIPPPDLPDGGEGAILINGLPYVGFLSGDYQGCHVWSGTNSGTGQTLHGLVSSAVSIRINVWDLVGTVKTKNISLGLASKAWVVSGCYFLTT